MAILLGIIIDLSADKKTPKINIIIMQPEWKLPKYEGHNKATEMQTPQICGSQQSNQNANSPNYVGHNNVTRIWNAHVCGL